MIPRPVTEQDVIDVAFWLLVRQIKFSSPTHAGFVTAQHVPGEEAEQIGPGADSMRSPSCDSLSEPESRTPTSPHVGPARATSSDLLGRISPARAGGGEDGVVARVGSRWGAPAGSGAVDDSPENVSAGRPPSESSRISTNVIYGCLVALALEAAVVIGVFTAWGVAR